MSDNSTSSATRSFTLPKNLLETGTLSTTNLAHECFVQQKFARDLQLFLVNYNLTVTGPFSLHV